MTFRFAVAIGEGSLDPSSGINEFYAEIAKTLNTVAGELAQKF